MLRRNDYLVAGLILSLRATVLAQREDGANKITYPNEVNQSIHYMDTVDVAFETDYATPWMYVFCNQSTGLLQEIIYYSPTDVKNRASLPITLKYDYMPESQCWFNLRSAQRNESDFNTEEGANSPPFSYNTTEGSQETFALSTTSASPTGTASVSTTSSSGTALTVTATVTASPSDASNSSDATASAGLSTGAKAGIGVGVSVVGLAVILSVAYIWHRRRKGTASASKPDAHESSPEIPKPHEPVATEKKGPYELYPDGGHSGPYELDPDRRQQGPYELNPDRDHHELS